MKVDEMLELMERIIYSLPDLSSGNEEYPYIMRDLKPYVKTERAALVGALRKHLSLRIPPEKRTHFHARPESRLWLSLSLAEDFRLLELKPDIEDLLEAVKNEEALRLVHANSIDRALEELCRDETDTERMDVEPIERSHIT